MSRKQHVLVMGASLIGICLLVTVAKVVVIDQFKSAACYSAVASVQAGIQTHPDVLSGVPGTNSALNTNTSWVLVDRTQVATILVRLSGVASLDLNLRGRPASEAIDPWGERFQIAARSSYSGADVRIFSKGPDKTAFTKDDIGCGRLDWNTPPQQ